MYLFKVCIYIGSDAPMGTHISKTVSIHASPYCARSVVIRRSVSQQVLRSRDWYLTRLDYGNATLAGLLSSQLNRLQSVMNAAGFCSRQGSPSTSHHCSVTFTGYGCPSGLSLKVGFHYPSSRAEFTGRVDGPRTRVHFLTPVNSGRQLG